jgi:hypothetical protein
MGTTSRWWICALCAVAMGALGCDDADDGSDADGPSAGSAAGGAPAGGVPGGGAPEGGAPEGGASEGGAPDGCPPVAPTRSDCDPLMPARCSMPWPSGQYLEPDADRTTGYTLRFGPETLPANVEGTHILPDDYARLDGYGPGEPLLVIFPNLSLDGMASEWDLAPSLADDAAVLWYEVKGDTMRRIPYWVELDAYEDDAGQKTVYVRPAILLAEDAHHYVAFRGLRDTSDAPIPPSDAFRQLRDAEPCPSPAVAAEAERTEGAIAFFEAQGVDRGSLTLAWDFHTGSSDGMHGWMLEVRDEALAAVGDEGPELTVTEVIEYLEVQDDTDAPVDPLIALELRGTFRAPNFMVPDGPLHGVMGMRMNLGDDGRPEQDGWREAEFWIRVPRSALDGTPHGLAQYGHGLLGRGSQVRGSFNSEIANDNHLIFFACNWTGMSEHEEPGIQALITEMSYFRWLADGMHQGMAEALTLPRAMKGRFTTLPAIADRGIVVDPGRFYYTGISQGGIFGATYMALTTDVTYGHLGVPGQNYSTLLHRSVDFLPFFSVVAALYPDPADQALVLSTIQLLWNQSDPVSYWRHIIAEPFAGTQAHQVIGAVARGDYQVAPVTMEIVARSDIGLALMENYDEEYAPDLLETTAYPHTGSGLTNWHFGNPWAVPGSNLPPEDLDADPHGKPRRLPSHNRQMGHFFETGEIIDVCEGTTCPPQSERE